MQNIEIEINGQRVDSDKNRVPLVFTRRIDLWDSFIGSEGTQAKSLNDTLYLPATKNNAAILANFDIYTYDSLAAQGFLFVQVFVNAVSVFAGYGQRISASKIGTQSDTFAIKILGDSVDVFSQLAGLSLRDLPMGSAPTTPADIIASWAALAVTTNPLIFAPAFYGGVTYNGVAVTFDNATYLRGLRPCVRIWNILEAIFEKQLGYKIISNFYQTEAFRNLVYPFGVGDAWLRSDAVAGFNCYVGAALQSFPPGVRQVKFPIETPPYNDVPNLNTLAGTFDPTPFGAGWYVFTFKINTGNNVDRVVLRGQSVTPPIVNINLGEYEPNTLVVTEPIYFEPAYGLRRMIFTVEGSSGTMSVSADSYYQAQLIDRFAYGAPLATASCLHDKTQKDFLRGLQHAFGLVIGIDNVSKQVYIDPRFNNATQPTVVPEGLTLSSEGYYNPNADGDILAVDIAETSLQHRRPFGDFLKLAYGEDSSDVYYEFILEQGDYSIAPLMGSKINFIAADKAGVTNRNPFFTYLMNVRIQPDISIPRQTVMPCMVQDLAELRNSNLNQNTPALFKCEPKLAMYYGVLDFTSPIYTNYYQWGFVDFVANTGQQLINTIPTFFQVFPDSAGYFSAFGDIPFSLAYTSPVYNNYPTPAFSILGLIDRFHSKYLSIIYNDKWYNLTARVKLDDYRTDLFKSPKLFNIGGQIVKCWQVSTEKFNPTDSDKADILVIADYDNIKSSTYSEEANNLIPLLTIGYIFELTTN